MLRTTVLGRVRVPAFTAYVCLLRVVVIATLASLLLPSSSFAQAAATGTITGRVQNASNGRFLNNARVQLEGTDETVFTNEYGEFVLNNVPAGQAKVSVFYSGLQPKVATITVPAGQTVDQTIQVGVAVEDDMIRLDEMKISAGRETNVAQIAVNEQRFSPNIKTVIETNAFGDVAEGNVGEFLKYLPGVTVDYVAADVRTVNVRGFGPAFSSVYLDGFRMASAASGSSIRAFEFEQVSINNAARVEVVKVPTPDIPADALGGSVNLISKNAFEREGRQLNYRVYGNANSEDVIPWDKSPGPGRKNTYKVLPGFDFDYTIPVTKNIGFVVTGLSSNQFNEQHRSQPTWNFAQAGATPLNPYLQQYQVQDGPKNSFRDSGSIKMDWRIAPGQSLWAMYQVNYYKSFFGNRNLTWDVGTNPASSTAGGAALTWGPDFTSSATGRGSVRHGTSFRDKYGLANAGAIKYRLTGKLWEVDAGFGDSHSRSWYRDTAQGHFSEVRTTLQGVSRVLYTGIREPRPTTIQALTSSGTEIDQYNMSNYRINTVRSQPLDAKDAFRTAHVNVKRKLDMLPFDLAVKTGGEVRRQNRDIARKDTTWNYVGADGTANTADDNAGNYFDTKYGPYPAWGFAQIPWPDPFTLYDDFVAHPNYFAQTADQIRNAERYRIQNSTKLSETIYSAYGMVDAHFMHNKLGIVAGARFERTEDKGNGPYTPTRGTTLADIQANWRERGLRVSKNYDGVYPSVNATYNITDSLLVRAAYALTLGRPDFSNILPLVRPNTSDTDFDDGQGTIPAHTVIYNNTGLKPYEADNYDLSLEYYFSNGGAVSGGVFHKNVTNFFGTRVGTITEADIEALNLTSDALGATSQTKINVPGSTKIDGVEFNFREPLNFLPGWGKNLTVFANATHLWLTGSNSADFSNFIETSGNVGLSLDMKPVVLRLNFNYRGRQMNSFQSGSQYGNNNIREYYRARWNADINAEYAITKNLGLFLNVRNLWDEPQDLARYNTVTPDYSQLYRREKFGAQITLGVKGTF